MSQEAIRLCGYRKVGGTYLVGSIFTKSCDRLPLPIYRCPTCGSGIKFSRGVQSINFYKYAGNHIGEEIHCNDDLSCYICNPSQFSQPFFLMWVGQEYSPATFIAEAQRMGISKRVPAKPRTVKPGTIVLLAHNDAGIGIQSESPYWAAEDPEETNSQAQKNHPGIFAAFVVSQIDKLIWQHEADDETLSKLKAQGINPVIIRDDDLDHSPDVSNDFSEDERAMHELNDLKQRFVKH